MTLELEPLATLRITIARQTRLEGLPTFETDDPDLVWLNTIQAVGKGVRAESSLVYELYRLR